MRLSVAIATPEVSPLPAMAMLSGSFPEKLAKAKAYGFAGVELMVMDPNQLDPDQMRLQIAAAGLGLASISSGPVAMAAKLTLMHGDAAVRRQALERLHDLIVFAGRIGAPLVTAGSLRGFARSMPADAVATLRSALQTGCQWAGENNVRLLLEPLNRYESDAIPTAQAGLDMISEVGSPQMGLVLDSFHMNIEERSPNDALQLAAAAGRLWHVHLGDSNRLPPGRGHFDFPGFVRTLKQIGYNGYMSAELLGRPDPDTAARQTAEYMLPLLHGAATTDTRRDA
jgi:5-keto-L-gluconate epimerase